jgi:type II secretory pathway predicted ATPase ExeA
MYTKRFGLRGHPLPKDACGKTFYDGGERFARFARLFHWLTLEPGLATLTGEAGVGKTAALRHLCATLPKHEYLVLYVCDTNVTATAVYRNLAAELGVRPPHRRDDLWRELKRVLVQLADEQGVLPIIVIDEAQHLPDDFFRDLAGFLNYAFDSRDLFTLWLVGLPSLERRLAMRHHTALATRIVSNTRMPARTDRDDFVALVEHGLTAAGATTKLFSDPALELLWRATRGIVRTASLLLRNALSIAHEREQNFVDDDTMSAAIDQLALTHATTATLPRPAPAPAPAAGKPRAQTGTKSRS